MSALNITNVNNVIATRGGKSIIPQAAVDAIVKALTSGKKALTDRGEIVRQAATRLNTTYANVYPKVRKAEANMGLTTYVTIGRRAGTKNGEAFYNRVDVIDKEGNVVAKKVLPDEAAALMKGKKGLKIA